MEGRHSTQIQLLTTPSWTHCDGSRIMSLRLKQADDLESKQAWQVAALVHYPPSVRPAARLVIRETYL